ncbi:MAG: phosphoribosylglycinamide formyltransferase [Gammaproteobacteria bacterium]|nr:phosphoribosylglycinamide formyltransferase [Gammaproteobacteria bacterium]
MQRLVVLISGNGSNLQAIIDACRAHQLNAQIVGVISDKKTAGGLKRAEKEGIKTIVQEKIANQSREEYDQLLAKQVTDLQPDWIVLAGWMRLLTNTFLNQFSGKVINIHPALPGTFPGTKAIERALQAYKKREIGATGVMVHEVPDEGVDSGPALGMKVVQIAAHDTLETLTERMHAAEHELLISVLQKLTGEKK